MSRKVIKCYIVIKRFLSKAVLTLDKGGIIYIKIIPTHLKPTRYLKSSLSPSELRVLMSLSENEYVVKTSDISSMLVSILRRERKDIKDLFNEEVKNVYQVTIYLNNGSEFKLLLSPNDYIRLRNYIRKYGT